MLSLKQIETDLVAAIKAKDRIAADTLRGLKTRIQNEQIAKIKELEESEILALVKSEHKRRKEAAESFNQGNRPELAEKELKEAAILEKYLPAQMSEAELNGLIEKIIVENGFAAKDFGKAMGLLKAQAGNAADGSLIAKLLKEKLK